MPGLDLPDLALPLPLRAPYRVLPDMHRFGGAPYGRVETEHFLADAGLPQYLKAKLELLQRQPELCRAFVTGDEPGLSAALWQALELAANDLPQLLEVDGEGAKLKALGLRVFRDLVLEQADPQAPLASLGLEVLAWLQAQPEVLRLADALALSVQEDYVIVHGDAKQHGAELLHVVFPSHWNPAAQAGKRFAALHQPVAHNETLLAAEERVMQALFMKGPFVRYAWGLVTRARLDHNPASLAPALPVPAELLADPEAVSKRVWLRLERQTTRALPQLRRCLFTIRVQQRPLQALEREEKRQLKAALLSMDETVLAYKGLTDLRQPLLSWLEGWS